MVSLGQTNWLRRCPFCCTRRKPYIEDLSPQDDLTKKYEKAVTRAYLTVRQGFSSDRVLADPQINAAFVEACGDLGIEDSVFHLNMALIGLRKHKKLQAKSKRSVIPDQWRYAVASEIAARVLFYRYGTSVDTTLAHPKLVLEFDKLAKAIAPGFMPFEYRWAALNVRKKGSKVKLDSRELGELDWSRRLKFDAGSVPTAEGIYQLAEGDTCLFVAGTGNLHESIQSQRRIAEIPLFPREYWQPNPRLLEWRYVAMPGSKTDARFGVVRSLVRLWRPIFNIPRGSEHQSP